MRTNESSEFDTLLREIFEDAGDRLWAEDRLWHDRVPDSAKAAGRETLSAMSAALVRPARPGRAAGLTLGKRLLIGAAVLLSSASLVTSAVFYASPALRERAAARFVADAAQPGAKAPAEYVIPAPWEEYEITDEGEGEAMVYKWFDGGRKQVLVEIAGRIPADYTVPADAAPVSPGGLYGLYSDTDETLLIEDGGVYIVIRYWNVEEDEALAYAETLIAANR